MEPDVNYEEQSKDAKQFPKVKSVVNIFVVTKFCPVSILFDEQTR